MTGKAPEATMPPPATTGGAVAHPATARAVPRSGAPTALHAASEGARRAVGALLVALVVAPVWALLDPRRAGMAAVGVLELSAVSASFLLAGTLLLLIPALLGARLVRPSLVERSARAAATVLERPAPWAFAAALAALACGLTALFSLGVLDGKPNLIDAMSQLLHARYLAAGHPSGDGLGAFRHLQNSILTRHGWISQYPPGHVLLLALGFRAGAVWAVGPVLAGTTVLFTTLAAERLLPGQRAVARLGSALLALSPFFLGLAAAYMNHVTAAAFCAAALYCALRAADGRGAWAVAAGALLGCVLATRPLAALAMGAVVCLAWLGALPPAPARAGRLARLIALATVGGAPFLAGLLAYNAYFFGAPLRFGYDVAWGPATRLGFHLDPWGNVYGAREALAYTSADLVALSHNLLETPFPAVVVVGLFLLLPRRLSPGERTIAAWALLPVAANVLYWHHGLFMGPRMLAEAAPAWTLLLAVAGVRVVAAMPVEINLLGGRYSPRVGLAVLLLAGLGSALAYFAPSRLLGYRGFMPSSRIAAPATSYPSLVFLHGGWSSRQAMRLAAAGMPLDSVETVIRQNDTCAIDDFVAAYAARRRGLPARIPALDLEPRASRLPRTVEIVPGDRIRVGPRSGPVPAECLRQAASDRNGILDASFFLWQGDLPGEPARGALVVHDLGPEANRAMLRRFPERRPMVYLASGPEQVPILVPYERGMAMLWGDGR